MPPESTGTIRKRFPSCFLSCSFIEEDRVLVSWFERIVDAVGFEVVKADIPQPRPPPEKIRDLIRTSDCFVAIFTRRTKVEGQEQWKAPEWVHDEAGMAFSFNKKMAIFVEEGVDIGGFPPMSTDYVGFTRSGLADAAPKIVQFLIELRRSVVGDSTPPDDSATALGLFNEIMRLTERCTSMTKPTPIPWKLSLISARVTGHFFTLPFNLQQIINRAYAAIEIFEERMEPPPGPKSTIRVESPDAFQNRLSEEREKINESAAEVFKGVFEYLYPEEMKMLLKAKAEREQKNDPSSSD